MMKKKTKGMKGTRMDLSLRECRMSLVLALGMLPFLACAETEPIDEDDIDPAINPPITFVEDDDELPSEETPDGPFPDLGYGIETTYAFPGCVGHGRLTKGARAARKPTLYRVTNLNSSGPGSFKEAISQPDRIIVFGVAGVIDMKKETYVFKNNQTVLFETAPGDGIELYNGRVSSSGAQELIVRYMRIRMGRQYSGSDSGDAGGLSSGKNQVFDHCSFTWGCDECFSINADNKGTRPQNITLQNSIVGQGCMNHSAGGLIQTNDNEGITIYRNLLIDNGTRNFKVKGLNQYVNNVVYNWGSGGAYIMGGDSQGHSSTVIENNYFITGPCNVWRNTAAAEVDPDIIGDESQCIPSGSDGRYYMVLRKEKPSKPFSRGNDGFDTYCRGNYYDSNTNGVLDGVEITDANWDTFHSFRPTFLSAPSSLHPKLEAMSAADAYEWVVQHVGASLPRRDRVDAFMIDELTSLGTKGTILRATRNTTQYPIADTWQQLDTANNVKDTDGDGMPDEWEDKWGLNKQDASDAVKVASNGFTNIENYCFSLEYPDKYIR